MQKQEKNFFDCHRSTFCIKVPFGIGHPHLHIKYSLYVCSRVQGSQSFKRNSIILIRSKVMAFLVILLSQHGPCGPHIVPVILMSSQSSPHHSHCPHIVPIAPRRSPWSPCGPHGCGFHCLHWGQHGRCPHIVPVAPTSSPHHLEGPHIIPNPLDTHPTQISKNAIRFELIEIF